MYMVGLPIVIIWFIVFNHQTFAVGFIRVRSEPSIFSNRTIRYRPSIVKKLTNLTTSAVNRKTLKNLKKLPFFGLFSFNLASGRGGTVNFLYSGSFPLTAINWRSLTALTEATINRKDPTFGFMQLFPFDCLMLNCISLTKWSYRASFVYLNNSTQY